MHTPDADYSQTLLRFNLQPCSLAKPFEEKAVGFYIHKNMDFIVTKRAKFGGGQARDSKFMAEEDFPIEVAALPGAYEDDRVARVVSNEPGEIA